MKIVTIPLAIVVFDTRFIQHLKKFSHDRIPVYIINCEENRKVITHYKWTKLAHIIPLIQVELSHPVPSPGMGFQMGLEHIGTAGPLRRST